jgi:HAD superfamily hydrolase (TIGR01458 family)
MALDHVDALLLDIDGVLVTSWKALPGSVETMTWIRARGLPFRLVTNTTTHTRQHLATTLRTTGFDVAPDEIVTAVVATATFLRNHHGGARVFVLSDGDARGDLDDIDLVPDPEDADVVVLGGASQDFTYDMINRIFRRVKDGAALVGMHRNLYWRTADGWQLDGGAYLAGLEAASGVTAAICGKPDAAFFESALELVGAAADRVLIVGDDIINDVLGAQAVGIAAALVHTGKFQPSDRDRGTPDHGLDSLADLPALLGG